MAQLVARLVRNEKVGGSNPPSSTSWAGLIARPFVYLLFILGQEIPGHLRGDRDSYSSRTLPREWAWGGARGMPWALSLASPASNPAFGSCQSKKP